MVDVDLSEESLLLTMGNGHALEIPQDNPEVDAIKSDFEISVDIGADEEWDTYPDVEQEVAASDIDFEATSTVTSGDKAS